MSRKKKCFGSYRKVNFLSLKKAVAKSKVDGVSIRNKSFFVQLEMLSWYDSPISHAEKSWKSQSKARKQYLKNNK